MTDWLSLIRPKVDGEGAVTYRCHTCGEPIDPDDLLIVEEPDLTTHHASHLETDEWPPIPA